MVTMDKSLLGEGDTAIVTVSLSATADYSSTCTNEYLVNLTCPESGELEPTQIVVPVNGSAIALFTAVKPSSETGVDRVTASLYACSNSASTDPYTVVKVEIVSPECGNVGCGDDFELTATIDPPDRSICWGLIGTGGSIVGDNLSANFTAGPKDAVLKVVAFDSGQTDVKSEFDVAVVGEYTNSPGSVIFKDNGYPLMGFAWGLTEADFFVAESWSVYFREDWWFADFGSIISGWRIGVDNEGRIPITSSADVDSNTWEEAVYDLEAIKVGGYVGSFVPIDAIRAHEEVHLNEWTNLVEDAGIIAYLESGEISRLFSHCDVHDEVQAKSVLDADVQAYLLEIYSALKAIWEASSEAPARAVSNAMIDQLIDAIFERAAMEGWE